MSLKTGRKILIVGSDSFIDEQIDKVLGSLKDLEVDKKTYYADEFDREDFVFFISSLPLFSDMKMAIIKKGEKLKNFDEIKQSIIKSESMVIVTANDLNFLSKAGKDENFEVISEPKKDKFSDLSHIVDIFKKLGVKLSKVAAEEIYEMCGKDFGIIKNEFDKLSVYYAYKSPESENEIIEKISFSKSENVFLFIDSFFDKNRKKCAEIISNMIVNNESVTPAFYMISKRLLQIVGYKINPSLVNERQFIMNKIKKNASEWSMEELSRCSESLLSLDYGSKTGNANIEEEIIMLLNTI